MIRKAQAQVHGQGRSGALESARMQRFLGRLLLAALILVLPVQGMATLAAGMCMALGHHGAAQADAHDHDAHDHHAQGQHDHQPRQAADHGHCGPCVACCAAASISGPVAFSPRAAPQGAVDAIAPLPAHGRLAERLDRPPLSR